MCTTSWPSRHYWCVINPVLLAMWWHGIMAFFFPFSLPCFCTVLQYCCYCLVFINKYVLLIKKKRKRANNIIDTQIKSQNLKLNAGEYRGRSQRAKGCIKLAPLTANPNDWDKHVHSLSRSYASSLCKSLSQYSTLNTTVADNSKLTIKSNMILNCGCDE